MTEINELNGKDCTKIDAQRVNAYFELKLDPTNATNLILDNSWEETSVDLAPAIKAGETKTTLKLSPEETPNYLEYDGEDGTPQCIAGEDLARIIPMTKLKDVDQGTAPSDGDVYVYDGDSNTFKAFNLKQYISTTGDLVNNLYERVTVLEGNVETLTQIVRDLQNNYNVINNKLNRFETILQRPDNIPADAAITWGNINHYADYTNTGLRTSGLYTHSISVDKINDEYDS